MRELFNFVGGSLLPSLSMKLELAESLTVGRGCTKGSAEPQLSVFRRVFALDRLVYRWRLTTTPGAAPRTLHTFQPLVLGLTSTF